MKKVLGLLVLLSCIFCINIEETYLRGDTRLTDLTVWVRLIVLFLIPLSIASLSYYKKIPIKKYPELLIMSLVLIIKPIVILLLLIITSFMAFTVYQQVHLCFNLHWYYDIVKSYIVIILWAIYILRVHFEKKKIAEK